MIIPQVLLIDDQYSTDPGLRQSFLENSGGYNAQDQDAGSISATVAISFCSGQRRENEEVVNDYHAIYQVISTPSPDGSNWAIVFLDVRFDSGRLDEFGLPQGREGDDYFGEEVRKRLALDFPKLPVVMLTSKKQTELHDRDTPYLSKAGLSPREMVLCMLRHGRLNNEQRRLLLGLGPDAVANSLDIFQIFSGALAVANSPMPVLLLGESGTGKEVVARYIHDHSQRKERPFVAVNVAAIPEDLVEVELFGHDRGAYTGAEQRRPGRFRQADGGTLFLDEIGDMPAAAQAKVLRTLQEGEVLPIGGNSPVKVDVRVIAATSRNLGAMQASGKFREDLIRRISGVVFTLPPLRDRPDDIGPLAEMFLQRYSRQMSKEGISFGDGSINLLMAHPYVGNVGELQNIIQGVVSQKGNYSIISCADIEVALRGSFVSSVTAAPIPAEVDSSSVPAINGLDDLAQMIKSFQVSIDDPLLKGGKALIERACNSLLIRVAGACLERFRDPRNGSLNRQAAMQFFTGVENLKGKGPGRVINELFGRKADTAVTDDDIEILVQEWSIHAGRSNNGTKGGNE
ncbi:MAG: sigma-54-dependent Fis family transcriptional regulator [Desulfobulbaceae bacterium]|nr:MAG: sigma-54-dependent Fis family transcriptional regulator [Desulfobulbaceae bacterium]